MCLSVIFELLVWSCLHLCGTLVNFRQNSHEHELQLWSYNVWNVHISGRKINRHEIETQQVLYVCISKNLENNLWTAIQNCIYCQSKHKRKEFHNQNYKVCHRLHFTLAHTVSWVQRWPVLNPAHTQTIYTPRKLCLWEGILFSRPNERTNKRPSDRTCVRIVLFP